MNKIIERILREANSSDLFEALTYRLNLSDLQSLLLEVYRRRVRKLTPRDVLRQFEQNHFVPLAEANPQKTIEFDRLAYSLLPSDVEVVELSPVAPLASQPGRIFSRTQLLTVTRGVAFTSYERAIDSHMRNLRRKIEPENGSPQYIITVHGVGYKFAEDLVN